MNSTERRRAATGRRAVMLLALVLTCLPLAGCGRSRETAVDSAAESLARAARSAAGAFAAEADAHAGEPFEQARPALLKALTDNSPGRDPVVLDATAGAEWRTVVLYDAQRPYSRGFTSDELTVAGCVEYRVRIAPVELLSARATDCPPDAAARYDETVRLDLPAQQP